MLIIKNVKNKSPSAKNNNLITNQNDRARQYVKLLKEDGIYR